MEEVARGLVLGRRFQFGDHHSQPRQGGPRQRDALSVTEVLEREHCSDDSAKTGSQSLIAWGQAVRPNLVMTMSHTGHFTVGENGVYDIVITNIGGAATSGTTGVIFVTDRLSGIVGGPGPGFTFVSMTGTGAAAHQRDAATKMDAILGRWCVS